MNALFGAVIKVFLALMEAHDAVGQNDGDGADRGDGGNGSGGMLDGHGASPYCLQ